MIKINLKYEEFLTVLSGLKVLLGQKVYKSPEYIEIEKLINKFEGLL